MNEYQITYNRHGVAKTEIIQASTELEAITNFITEYDFSAVSLTHFKIKQLNKFTYKQLKEKLITARILLIGTWLYFIVLFILKRGL